MQRVRAGRVVTAVAAVALVGGTAAVVGQAATAAPSNRVRQGDFTDAAKEFGVPQRVLLAVSYAETRWDDHAGHPSTTGAYGPMGLVWRPAGAVSARGLAASDTRTQSLIKAARLIHTDPAKLRTDPKENIRGGAALLAYWAKHLGGGRAPASEGRWYPAVAKYSGSTNDEALTFADDVYSAMRGGASRTTADGQRMAMRAGAVTPDTSATRRMRLAKAPKTKAECPASLHCLYTPAAYAQTDPSDPAKYGNYDQAKRPRDMRITTIVIHDTEETYDKTKRLFGDPTSAVSSHYVVRSSDGQITQMVPTRDVPWHAGNWDTNMHSVGIEHEGYEAQGATWFTEPMYRSSARLVRYLAKRFDIPVDRGHIIGHDNVPGQDAKGTAAMHTDPGPYWDWNHYLDLVRGHTTAPAWNAHARQVTIAPDFSTNKPPVTTCAANGTCTNLPSQGASFVYLRTKPADDAPLLNDPTLETDGKPSSTKISDWGARASAGQRFAVAARKPGWTGIWYAGQIGWFRDSKATPTTRPAKGRTVTPRAATAATYGVAFPEKAEYPKQIPAVAFSALPYTLEKGQRYTLVGSAKADYYYAKTIDASLPGDHTVVHGKQTYDLIQLGHRLAYVKATDVERG